MLFTPTSLLARLDTSWFVTMACLVLSQNQVSLYPELTANTADQNRLLFNKVLKNAADFKPLGKF